MTSLMTTMVHHINATHEDFEGNGKLGRYVLMPGSDGRAKSISERLTSVKVLESSRRLNCYLGSYQKDKASVDVAIVSSGMGCPSMDIVINELLMLGAKRFIRVGTAGSMQSYIRFGDLVIASGAVRDEATTKHYTPIEVPALADTAMVLALEAAAKARGLDTHTGIVHCKDSLFAREFGVGPLSDVNQAYMALLTASGVLASEMETSALFIRCQIAAAQMRVKDPSSIVPRAAAILSVIGDAVTNDGDPFSKKDPAPVIDNMIGTALDATITLLSADLKKQASKAR